MEEEFLTFCLLLLSEYLSLVFLLISNLTNGLRLYQILGTKGPILYLVFSS